MTRFSARKLADEQKRQKVSNLSLARQAGISHVYLSEIRKGKKRPSAEVAHKLAGALGVPVESLFTPAEAAGEGALEGLTEIENAVLAALRVLTEAQKVIVLAYAQGLAASGSRTSAEKAAELQRDVFFLRKAAEKLEPKPKRRNRSSD